MTEIVRNRRFIVGLTSVATVLAVLAGFLVLSGYSSRVSPAAAAPTSTSQESGPATLGTPEIPTVVEPVAPEVAQPLTFRNVVLVLADDLDWKLFDQIPRLAALKDKGMTFTNHTVVDSLCCPSRVTI